MKWFFDFEAQGFIILNLPKKFISGVQLNFVNLTTKKAKNLHKKQLETLKIYQQLKAVAPGIINFCAYFL